MNVLVYINYAKKVTEMTLQPLILNKNVDMCYVVRDRDILALKKVEWHSPPKYLYKNLPMFLQGTFRNLFISFLMMWLCITKKVDIVISYNIIHSVPAFICGKLFRKPIIANIDDSPIIWNFRRLLIPLLKRCDAVTTTGNRNRDYLIKMGVRDFKVFVLPDSIDMNKFKTLRLAKKYDVVTVARLTPAKNLHTLLKVIVKVKTYKSDIKLCIVGDGLLEYSLKELANELKLEKNVDFVGFKENPEIYYNSSRIFVLTSYYEGLPMAMLEAMACGIPCIVSNVGDVFDIAKDGGNAIIVNDPYDIDGFADAILKLLNDKLLYKKLSTNTREVRRRYSYDSAISAWDEIFSFLKRGGNNV